MLPFQSMNDKGFSLCCSGTGMAFLLILCSVARDKATQTNYHGERFSLWPVCFVIKILVERHDYCDPPISIELQLAITNSLDVRRSPKLCAVRSDNKRICVSGEIRTQRNFIQASVEPTNQKTSCRWRDVRYDTNARLCL